MDKVKEELKKITQKEVQINIVEIRRPELDANIAETIYKQLEARINFRRAIKMAVASNHENGCRRCEDQGIRSPSTDRDGRSEEYNKAVCRCHIPC